MRTRQTLEKRRTNDEEANENSKRLRGRKISTPRGIYWNLLQKGSTNTILSLIRGELCSCFPLVKDSNIYHLALIYSSADFWHQSAELSSYFSVNIYLLALIFFFLLVVCCPLFPLFVKEDSFTRVKHEHSSL
jgi:hypothetical protein